MLPRSGISLRRAFLCCRLLAIAQDLFVLGGKLAVAAGFDFTFAGERRHVLQSLKCALHIRAQRRFWLRAAWCVVGVRRSWSPCTVAAGRRHHGVDGKDPWAGRKIIRGSGFVIHVDRACRRRWLPGSRRIALIGRVGFGLRIRSRRRRRVVPIVILRRPAVVRRVVVVLVVVGIPPVVVVRWIRPIVPYESGVIVGRIELGMRVIPR